MTSQFVAKIRRISAEISDKEPLTVRKDDRDFRPFPLLFLYLSGLWTSQGWGGWR